jgi:hypothetical protein
MNFTSLGRKFKINSKYGEISNYSLNHLSFTIFLLHSIHYIRSKSKVAAVSCTEPQIVEGAQMEIPVNCMPQLWMLVICQLYTTTSLRLVTYTKRLGWLQNWSTQW